MRDISKANVKYIIIFFVFLISIGKISAQKKDQFVVVLDAGHGGDDGGARGVGGTKEKEITLDVTLKLGAEIEKKFPDVKVVYTRKTDVFIPLYERANIANKNNADLFISIHCNAAKSTTAKGTETFVLGLHREQDNLEVAKRENSVILLEENYQAKYQGYDPRDPASIIGFLLTQGEHQKQSIRIAQLVENSFLESNRESRGVKQAGFLVIRETAMPSVLIELGFITNEDEGSFLGQESGREKTVSALLKAFRTFKTEYDEKNSIKNVRVEDSTPNNVKPEVDVPGKTYKVQFLVSQKKHPPNSPLLKGLRNVEIVKSGNVYKYYYGNTFSISKKNADLKYVREHGFPDAFSAEFTDENYSSPAIKGNYYTVQLFLSRKKIDPDNKKLRGLRNVRIEEDKGIYYYYYGKTNKYQEAVELLKKVKATGFDKAIVIKK